MSDDSDRLGEKTEIGQPDLDGDDDRLGSIETTEGVVTATDAADGLGFGRRVVGLLAIVLGILGCLVALFLAFSSLRLLFGASDRADDAMNPVIASLDRLEDRIDQADDLADREGIEPDRVPELRARVDGLVDITSAAERSFAAIDDHPIYTLLPADLDPLGRSLDGLSTSAAAIDETMGSSPTIRPASAAAIADELDGMQSAVGGTRDTADDAKSSLRRWLRIGGLLGFLASLAGFWSQVALTRRGWRGFRNRPV